eukprot:5360513-Karenia_brevis.AAC.1
MVNDLDAINPGWGACATTIPWSKGRTPGNDPPTHQPKGKGATTLSILMTMHTCVYEIEVSALRIMNQTRASTFSIAIIDLGSTKAKAHVMGWATSMTLIETVATTNEK